MLKRKNNVWLVCLLVVGVGLACSFGDQTDEANKLVDEANAQIKVYNENQQKSLKLFTELLGDNLTKAEDVDEYKKANKAKFDELLNVEGQMEKSGTEATAKFEQAAKLQLNEKYKEYLNAKAQEFKKSGERDKLTVPFIKAFLEEKDTAKMDKLIEDYNKKNADFAKETEELRKKADQIAKDNPTIIKGN